MGPVHIAINNECMLTDAINVCTCSSFSAVLSQKRSRRDTSLSVAEDPIHIAMEERNEELIKGDDMDLPEVCASCHCVILSPLPNVHEFLTCCEIA